jgi:DNA-binding CsgD family transcriptional regulator
MTTRTKIRVRTLDFEKLLSASEMQMMCLLSSGLTNGEIARRIDLSPKSITRICTQAAFKIGLKDTKQLRAVAAIRYGEIEVGG